MSRKSIFVKNVVENLPYSMGRLLAKIPFELRPGIGYVYRRRVKEQEEVEALSEEEKKNWVFQRIKSLVEFAEVEIPFYRNHYGKFAFTSKELISYEDISRIPIINKSDLLGCSLEERSFPQEGRYVANTGGSSGRTLSFYITPDSMGHEWAHMHQVWEKLDYKPHDLKMTFGGHYSGEAVAEYDAVRHQLNINIYKKYANCISELIQLFTSYKIKYLHGYPSAIFDFATFCSQAEAKELLEVVRQNLKGVLFGSEYPAPVWRQKIEDVFLVDSVSWYGHTERAVLAYEKNEQFTFAPFVTYGFAEGIDFDNGCHLVGTSYYNFAGPLIRYDTEDIIEPTRRNGFLESFRIKEGRSGEFILDEIGAKIPLTGLVFGRHHKLFDSCQYIQIAQNYPGEAVILYVPLPNLKVSDPALNFVSEGIAVNFSFLELKEPIRTPGGKIKLLVSLPSNPQ